MKKKDSQGKQFYGRKKELDLIDDFIKEQGAGIIFIKGRRRIGKTWVLNKIKQKHKRNILTYSGKSGSIKKKKS